MVVYNLPVKFIEGGVMLEQTPSFFPSWLWFTVKKSTYRNVRFSHPDTFFIRRSLSMPSSPSYFGDLTSSGYSVLQVSCIYFNK